MIVMVVVIVNNGGNFDDLLDRWRSLCESHSSFVGSSFDDKV